MERRPAHRPKLPPGEKLVRGQIWLAPATEEAYKADSKREGVSEGEWKRRAVLERLERRKPL